MDSDISDIKNSTESKGDNMYNHTTENRWAQYTMTTTLSSGKKLILRTPTKSDAPSLVEHMIKVDSETKFLGREPGEFSFTTEQEEAFIEHLSKDDNQCFLIGTIDDEVIANVSAAIVRNNLRFLHRASMGITVQKKYWGQGIGKLLIATITQWCKDKALEQLELEVVTDNIRAVQLYQKCGFEIFGTKKRALKYKDNSYADEYHMIHFLK